MPAPPRGRGGELGRCPTARGSKSRNKVVVGEPAAGSLPYADCRSVTDRLTDSPAKPGGCGCPHRGLMLVHPTKETTTAWSTIVKSNDVISVRGGTPCPGPSWQPFGAYRRPSKFAPEPRSPLVVAVASTPTVFGLRPPTPQILVAKAVASTPQQRDPNALGVHRCDSAHDPPPNQSGQPPARRGGAGRTLGAARYHSPYIVPSCDRPCSGPPISCAMPLVVKHQGPLAPSHCWPPRRGGCIAGSTGGLTAGHYPTASPFQGAVQTASGEPLGEPLPHHHPKVPGWSGLATGNVGTGTRVRGWETS